MSDDVAVLLRLATDDDVPAIERLIQASIRGLFPGAYDDRATAAAARHVGHVDRALIEDGTFFVIVEDGDLLACGGWSRRRFVGQAGVAAADRVAFDPTVEAAHIRSIFTRPDRVREGLASQILAACEAAVRSSGFRWLTLRASLPGIPLYARHGYLVTDRFVEPLDDGIAIEVATMVKMLVDSEGGARAADGLGMDPSRHPTIADARTTLRQADAARTAGRKMIARGERPMYRVEVIRTTPDVGLRIVELPWLTGFAASVRDVPGAARSVVAAWLDVHPEAFDLVVG